MKKFTKIAFSVGLATSLLIPTTSFAATPQSIIKQAAQKDARQTMDTFIVKYSERITKKEHSNLGTTVVQSIPALKYDVVRINKGQDTKEVFKKYKKLKKVTNISPSVQYTTFATNDQKVKDAYALSSLHIEEAWKHAGNKPVTVAVIDTGLNVKHPELQHSMLPPYNVVNPAGGFNPEVHGTHVAGIIAAKENNELGAYGINPKAKILPVDVFGGEQGAADYNIAKGILYAVDHGADVINMSLGGPRPSAVVQEAINKAIEKNVVIVAAAGNDGESLYSYPASYNGVISVGATDADNRLTDFSTYGPSMDIVAPGAQIFSTIYTPEKPDTYAKLNGTSMASPIVAGVASLIKSKYPDLNSYQVEALLKSTATDLGEKGYDIKYGYGLVNPVAALDFDVSKLSNYAKPTPATLENAEAVTFENNSATRKGALTKPFESHNYKINLDKGNYAQFALESSENFDYKLRLHFYPEGSKEATETITVNDTLAGKVESGLFKAKEKGTLVVEVTDANGNYDPNGSSSYTLTMNFADHVNDTMASAEKPYNVTSLPFQSNNIQDGAPTFAGEGNVDTDYYRVRFPYDGYGQINMNAITGVDTSITIYPENKKEDINSHIVGENSGTHEKEAVAFPVKASETYIVEVTGNGPKEAMMGEQAEKRIFGSILPYELTIDMANMPNDEDNFPAENASFDLFAGEELTAAQSAQMLQSAVPMNIDESKKAFFQRDKDIDLYKVTAKEDTIISTELAGNPLGQTMLKLYEYNEEAGVLTEKMNGSLFSMLAALFGGGAKDANSNYMLEANKQYVIAATSLGSITGHPYEIKTKTVTHVTQDEHGMNNDPETATPIELNSSIKDRLVTASDIDMYYLKMKEDALTSFKLKTVMMDNAEKEKYPSSLTMPPFYMLVVAEDTNGNKKLDPEEEEKMLPYENLQRGIAGSFQGKKDVGYFFMIQQHPFSMGASLNVNEYELSVSAVNQEDEDKDSVVKDNVPSKPIELKTENHREWKASGLYNAGVSFGDSDYYVFTNPIKQNVTISLTSPKGLDSVLSIYKDNGDLIKKVDSYLTNDAEEITLNLNKGKYYIKAEDVKGASSNDPYQLSVMIKPHAGWNGEGENWYYFHPDTLELATGWLHDGGKWYYLHPNDGRMQTGWLLDNGVWYYLHNSGAMATGWVFYGGNWYYLENSGAMKTGWLSQGGKWYYLNQNGAMAEGWKEIGGKWYYFDKDRGEMAANTWIGNYWIDTDGAWAKTR
ncbi:S8 family serine peptidase [Bacillus sp. S14(2024)]|uniref:S8 family serine peptidase n=1 Tax=Bacillus sp. S14(2024) TaxID=3162884 RepID=UPI003D1E7151